MKFKNIFSVFFVLFLFLSSACASPSESSDEELNLGADFIRGFDASMVSQLEEYGNSFYNENGTLKDDLCLFQKHLINRKHLNLHWSNFFR